MHTVLILFSKIIIPSKTSNNVMLHSYSSKAVQSVSAHTEKRKNFHTHYIYTTGQGT